MAPASLLAPLAALTLVWNMIVAKIFMKEELSRMDVGATMVIFLGATLTVVFANHSTPNYSLEDLQGLYSKRNMIIYLVLIPIFILAHYVTLKLIQKYQLAENTANPSHKFWCKVEMLCYAGVAGSMGGQSILFAKSTVELVKNAFSGGNPFAQYPTYLIIMAMASCMFCQITFLNGGLTMYDSLIMVPAYQAYWIIMGVLGGLVYFDEISAFTPLAGAMFCVGTLVAISGVAVLTQREIGDRGGFAAGAQELTDEVPADMEASPAGGDRAPSAAVPHAAVPAAVPASQPAAMPESRRSSGLSEMPQGLSSSLPGGTRDRGMSHIARGRRTSFAQDAIDGSARRSVALIFEEMGGTKSGESGSA